MGGPKGPAEDRGDGRRAHAGLGHVGAGRSCGQAIVQRVGRSEDGKGACDHGPKGEESGRRARTGARLKSCRNNTTGGATELKDKIREKKRIDVQMEIIKLETSIAAMKEQQEAAAKEIAQMKAEVEGFGRSTVDIEMLRSELKRLRSRFRRS